MRVGIVLISLVIGYQSYGAYGAYTQIKAIQQHHYDAVEAANNER